ncbi:MAG: divalent-cation tolerance protein CutA [Planctomycetes bacterium]|nr:divalent-cation tolerance protein CutA [Planctomycetota bacterium]
MDPHAEERRLRPDAIVVVFVTAPDLASGRELARALVDARLAACVNVIPGVTSVYRWQGAVEESSEVLLVVKSVAARLGGLEARVRDLHPYSVPEFVVLDAAHVSAPYGDWLRAETADEVAP